VPDEEAVKGIRRQETAPQHPSHTGFSAVLY
jgi:hypothetical protein